MHRIFVLLLVLFCHGLIFSQTSFQKRFGWTSDDEGRSVMQTPDGGYVITGKFALGVPFYDLFILKTDANGDSLWMRTFGNSQGNEQGFAVTQTNDSGYIAVGFIGAAPDFNVFAARTDKNGDSLWVKTYAFCEIGYTVCSTVDHGFIIAGRNKYNTNGQQDMFAMRLDSLGDTLWVRDYGGADDEQVKSICATPDSGFILAGETYSFGLSNQDLYLVKINGYGDTLWSRTYGDSLHNNISKIQSTLDGNYFLSASTSYGINIQKNHLLKIDQDGNLIWMKSFGDSLSSLNFNATQTNDSGYVLTGSYSRNLLLIKTDKNGDTLWTNSVGQGFVEWGNCISSTSDGGCIITGTINVFDSLDYDILLMKIDSNGNPGCFSYRPVIDTSTTLFTVTYPHTLVRSATAVALRGSGVNDHRGIYSSDVCSTVSVSENPFENKNSVYPNPSYGKIRLSIESPSEVFLAEMNGKILKRFYLTGTGETEIDLSEFSSGIYILNYCPGKTIVARKLILIN